MSAVGIESLRDKHKGETVWIIGKGPSLEYLRKEDVGTGLVIALNESIIKIESLGLDNVVYSMQKDGGDKRDYTPDNLSPVCEYRGMCEDRCGDMVRPKKRAALLLHEHESKYCYEDYEPRYIFDFRSLGLPHNDFSMICAVKIAQLMGCASIRFVCCDYYTNGNCDIYIPGQGIAHKNAPYAEQQGKRLYQHLDGLDVEWITPKGGNELCFSFGVLINDTMRFDTVLRKSKIYGNLQYIYQPESATKGLNKLLDIIEGEGADIAILAHQDMYFRHSWLDHVREQIAKLPETWVCAGIIGKDMQGRLCGNLHDMRIPQVFNTSNIHEFPQAACCFDECCIIINMKKRFRFNEGLDGFDLYGTLCVLQSWEMGDTAWIIDAFAEHYCMRPFTWFPDEKYAERYKWLYDNFPNAKLIESTVLGAPEQKEAAA